MKTIKIKDYMHKNLCILKTEWNKKTINDTIQELFESYFGDLIVKEKEYDQKRK